MGKQTAVSWFVKEIQTRLTNDGEVNYVQLAKEAKQIEKENTIMAFKDGRWSGPFVNATAEEYYNENYNN
jgi:hypothetical protein